MRFEKENTFGAKKFYDTALDKEPICFKGRLGQKEKLKSIDGWQEKLRDYIDLILKNTNQESE